MFFSAAVVYFFYSGYKWILRVQWACPEQYAAHQRDRLVSSLSGEFQIPFPANMQKHIQHVTENHNATTYRVAFKKWRGSLTS